MVDTKGSGDEKKVVKMEKYRYIINETINRDIKIFFKKRLVPPAPSPNN
jgi:hypothetical protein